MNLYIINEKHRGTVYGIGTYIRELSAALQNSDINVCVVNLIAGKRRIEKEEIDGIKHWFFPAPMPEQWMPEDPKQWELYHRNIVYLLKLHIEDKKNLIFHLNYHQRYDLAKELKNGFQCIIVTTVHYFDWCFSLLGNVQRFRKIISSQKDKEDDLFNENVKKVLNREKALFEIADHIICLLKDTCQILENDYLIKSDKIKVVYNGLSNVNTGSDKSTLRLKYHIPDIPIILFVGRIDYLKGLIYAIRALKIVLAKQICHLIIVGDGEFSWHVKECEDIWIHITWTGLISKDKLYDLYSIADIGVLPSLSEQCNYAAIEMMMHGLPMIGSAIAGLKEMIVNDETGLHIPVIECEGNLEVDIPVFAQKILYLLQNPDERKRLGENARKRYEQVYSSAIFRENMLAFYRSLYE